MKKYLLSIFAVSALLFAASSCSEEEEIVSSGTGLEKVSFQIEMDGTGPSSRSIGDGKSVTTIYYEVWDKDADKLLSQYDSTEPVKYLGKGDNGKDIMGANLTFDLVKGVTYNILFWAQSDESAFDPTNLKEVTIKDNLLANQESYDAFTAAVKDYKVENTAKKTSVKLKRPFAQVNVGTSITDWDKAKELGVEINRSKVVVKNSLFTKYDVLTGLADDNSKADFIVYDLEDVLGSDNTFDVNGTTYHYLGMNYVLAANEKSIHDMDIELYVGDKLINTLNVTNMPIQRNHRTNIIGNLLTSNEAFDVVIDADFEDKEYGKIDGQDYIKVNTVEDFYAAFADEECDIIILDSDIVLSASASRSAVDPTLTISNGKSLTIDLNGKTLSATSTQADKNYDMFLVKGNLTVKNGTVTTNHTGANMGWSAMTTIFDITAGGVLNLNGVTAKNEGGSDMAFVAHLNNWGEVTLNVEESTLESTYVPVRVFNSGPDMNNVTIKKSTLKGASNKWAFWVQLYTLADFGNNADKTATQQALLNLNIYNQGNTFSPDINGICYGDTQPVASDAYGITKSVSEDGAIVTLGSVTEDGLIRRGVVGAEENRTITKVIVEEGVTTLYDRTFRRFYALETVELPSTLTTIGAAGSGVFQSCTALKNIVIPESVTVLGKGTFQECSSLESINIPAGVTRIEENALRATGLKSVEFHAGVTYFGAQSFRDCKQLKEVIINAPKFTIEANAFGSMAAPYPAATIYVANAEMKAYLESTLAYANQFSIVAPEEVNDQDGLENAIQNDKSTIALAEGTYVLPVSAQGKTLKIVGSGDPAKTIVATNTSGSYEGCNYNLQGSTVVFENISITTDNLTYTGYAGCNATFNNCIINNSLTLYGDMVFNNCVFNVSGDQYNIWTWAAPTATFKSCTFNSDGKSILLYGGKNTKLIVDNCVFNDTGVLSDLKAAIEVGSDYGTSVFELIVNNTIVNGYEINDKGINTGTTLWGNKNSMSTDKLNVVVDGVDVY